MPDEMDEKILTALSSQAFVMLAQQTVLTLHDNRRLWASANRGPNHTLEVVLGFDGQQRTYKISIERII